MIHFFRALPPIALIPLVIVYFGVDDRQARDPVLRLVHCRRNRDVRRCLADRDQLLREINDLTDGDELALWAHRRIAAKNTLTSNDASVVEAAYRVLLEAPNGVFRDQPKAAGLSDEARSPEHEAGPQTGRAVVEQQTSTEVMVSPIRKEVRHRNKAHLAFVRAQPCLVCRRSPCDAHHLKFAQPRSLGRKVSDEFTVPLCRDHHLDLHRYGNETAWWANLQIEPTKAAKDLWQTTLLDSDQLPVRKALLQPSDGGNQRAGPQLRESQT
jgi:hypothetical protein